MQYDLGGTYATLVDVQLGDVVTIGAGQSFSVRAVERELAEPVGTMHGFVLAGEVGPQSALLSIPASAHDPVGVYTPLDHIPVHARTAIPVCQGVVSYWAPHLPNLSGAQGELGYKVARVRGSVDPMVLVWRGDERVVYMHSSTFPINHLRFTCLPRDASSTEIDQRRHAAVVHQEVTTPYEVPAPVPLAEPVPARRRRFW